MSDPILSEPAVVEAMLFVDLFSKAASGESILVDALRRLDEKLAKAEGEIIALRQAEQMAHEYRVKERETAEKAEAEAAKLRAENAELKRPTVAAVLGFEAGLKEGEKERERLAARAEKAEREYLDSQGLMIGWRERAEQAESRLAEQDALLERCRELLFRLAMPGGPLYGADSVVLDRIEALLKALPLPPAKDPAPKEKP